MNRRAKAKIKDFAILTVVLVASITFCISLWAIAEERLDCLVPFIASSGVLWWFAEANK